MAEARSTLLVTKKDSTGSGSGMSDSTKISRGIGSTSYMSSGISSASEGEESHFQTLNKADRGHDHLPLFYCLQRHALLVEELLSQ